MEKKRYFAFISYQSNDVEWAKWLEHELDFYHLPSNLDPSEKTLHGEKIRDNLRDVFWDSRLAAGGLDEGIKSKLECSANMIVICSPNSANVEEHPWVNKEIQYFIALGRLNHIFPFIVEGENPKEFFPPALFNLPEDKERVGGNVNKDGKDAAFVKIVAGMLDVDVDILWQHYEKEKAKQEREEREKKEKLQIAQSRFLAEKANDLISKGDSYLASLLSLNALPIDLKTPNRPYVLEAEATLRKSLRKKNAFFFGHDNSVTSSIISPDGTRIFSVSWDEKLCAWNSLSGRLITSRQKHTKPINSVTLRKDASMLATASKDKRVILWDSKSLKQICSFIYDATVNYASFSPCGKFILAAVGDNVCISDIEGNQILLYNENSDFDLKEVFQVIMIDEGQIVTSSFDGIKVWKWEIERNTIELHKWLATEDKGLKVQSIIYCPKSKSLVFGQGVGLYLWSLPDYRLIKRIQFPTMITALAINKDENQIAVACYDYLYLIDIPREGQSWRKASLVSRFEHCISDLSFYPNNEKCLLLSFNNGPIRLLDISENKGIKETSILAESLSFISNNRFVVASSYDIQPGTIYDIKFGTRETFIPEDVMKRDHEHYGISYKKHNQIVFNKKGKKIYCISDGDAYVYDLNNKMGETKSISFLSHYRCCFKSISEDGRRALYAFKDGTMYLVDVLTGKKIKMLEKTYNHTLIHSACFSSDSMLIATTSNEGKVRVYNAKDGSLIQRMRPIQTLWGNSIEFSQKGDMIICASQDYYVYIWACNNDEKRFKLKKRLSGHEERVCCASFSLDGKMAVSLSPSKVIVWDVESGFPIEVIEMESKEHGLNFVKFSPNNTHIYVSREGRLVIIDFPRLQKLIDAERKRFRNRKLSEQELKQYYLK